jgi:hypothetical protein
MLQYMAYDAVAVGEKEISWGLDDLETMLAEHDLDPVSCNILVAETEKPRFKPHKMVKVGDLDVGVTSIIGGGAVVPRTLKEREGIFLADPIASANETLKKMKKADVKILIAHVGQKKAEEWADSLSGYDVILVGYGGKQWREPKKQAGVILAATGARSNWFGEVTLTVEDGQITMFGGRSYELKQDGPVDDWVKSITWTKLELDEKGDRIRKTRNDRDADKRKAEAEKRAAERKAEASFIGGDKCAHCHVEIHSAWTETAHAHAFESIAESEDWENPECWSCHVVGYGTGTGHPANVLEPAMWNVQCEACHGEGTEHVRGAGRAKVNEKTCLRCHTKEWSPDWNYKEYLEKVVCTVASRH